MNFGRRGIRSRQDYLASKSRKRMKKIILGISHILLVGVIGLCAVGVSLGVGVFRGVIDSTPNQTVIDVSPKGFSSFVYDAKKNQVAKLVSADSNRIPVSADILRSCWFTSFWSGRPWSCISRKKFPFPKISR